MMKDRNVLKGLFLMAIALAFGLGSLKYPIGKLERAGPGFFPMMVSSILFLLGLAMLIRSRYMDRVPMVFNMKNLVVIMMSLVGFALLSKYVNMIVGITFLVFVSTFAGKTYSWKRNALVTLFLVGVAFIFQKGLGLQLPLY
jgi:Tripartite tricarboxylate transporter TctB family